MVLADVGGPARALLTGERTALNFLGRISGIATLTRQFVDAVRARELQFSTLARLLQGCVSSTNWLCGAAVDKITALGLFDLILIKDNHIDFAGSLAKAVQRRAKRERNWKSIRRERSRRRRAAGSGVDRILLDNMSVEMMREAVKLVPGRAKLEASGNVTLETVRAIAETGVDYISVGALTHSPRVFDVSLKWKTSRAV